MLSQYSTILILLSIVVFLSYMSQRSSLQYEYYHQGSDGRKHMDIWLFILIVFLIFFAGLRTSYNDTSNYAYGFVNSDTIRVFLSNPENFKLTSNPLFYGFEALIRTFTGSSNVFFFICAIIGYPLMIRFIKRNVDTNCFMMSMIIYCCIGVLMLSVAAQKQILTMSVLTIAMEALFDKKYFKFYIVVFIAGLIHTYAWMFLFLPLLDAKPWGIRAYVLLIATFAVMYTFESTITTFIEAADQVGKNIAVEEVFDDTAMSVFRVAVYTITPLVSLIFQNRLSKCLDRKNQIFIQMSIITMAFMLLGSINGANMFGRAGYYFELGYICALPWMIKQLFTKQSAMIVLTVATIAFTGFYCFDNKNFDTEYSRIEVIEFVNEIL